MPQDYLGDGKARIAIWRPSDGTWYIKGPGIKNWDSSKGNMVIQHGAEGDVPVPGDYLGDGKSRLAIWRDGDWCIKGEGFNDWDNSPNNMVI